MRKGKKVSQSLIRWVNLQPEDATWEDTSFIQAQFPDFQIHGMSQTIWQNFDPWGQGSFSTGGICHALKDESGYGYDPYQHGSNFK